MTKSKRQDLEQLDQAQLLDKLMEHTQEYLTMLRNGAEPDKYQKCKEEVQGIILEVQRRSAENTAGELS